MFLDALPDKRRLSILAEMLQKLESYHFPLESRQPILTALYEFNLVRLANHYSKLFNLPLPERSLPLPPPNPASMNDNNNNGNAVRTDMRYDLIRLTISPSRKYKLHKNPIDPEIFI